VTEVADVTAAREPRLELVLPAASPHAWIDTHLGARFDRWEVEAGLSAPAEVRSTSDLLLDDAEPLRSIHRKLVDGGAPAPAAASYLADWFAGAVAGAIGYSLAAAGAGLRLVGDVGFHLHPDGWPLRLDLPATALVLPDHPWAGLDGCDLATSVDDLLARTVRELVVATTPLIDALHGMARIGIAGLWNEVGDALGAALAFQHDVTPTPAMVAVLDAAVQVPEAPWRARPRLSFADSAVLGRIHVAQKGGCCLAYTRQHDGPVPTADDPGLEPYHRAYLARFPVDPDAPRYCSTCSFRDPADTAARQVFWHEHRA
jgi:hypothetical protein